MLPPCVLTRLFFFFLSFHETFPDRLVKLQDAHWIPLIEWVEKTYDVKIELYESILNTRQPDATVLKLGSIVSDFDAFKLAGAYPPSSFRNRENSLHPHRG